jgi:hypothetical protein
VLQPKSGSRRQKFCGGTCRQAAHRAKKWDGVHVRPALSRSVSGGCSVGAVDSIEAELIAGLGSLDDLEPKRRDFWRRRARRVAEAIAAERSGAPIPTPVTIKSALDPATRARADALIAAIPADLSIPHFLKRQVLGPRRPAAKTVNSFGR